MSTPQKDNIYFIDPQFILDHDSGPYESPNASPREICEGSDRRPALPFAIRGSNQRTCATSNAHVHTSTQAKRHSVVRLRTCVTCASPIGMAGACMSMCDHSLSYASAPGGSQNTHLLSRTRRGEPLGRPPPPSLSSAALYVAHPATRVALPEVPSARVLMRTPHA